MTLADSFVDTLHQWIETSMKHSMRNFIHYARENGLSMSQLGALFHLNHMGSSGVSDLGDHLGVTSAAASQMLDRLVQQGLILRSENPNDRRVKQVVITDKGCQILEEGIRARQGWLDNLANKIVDEDKVHIIAALNILIDTSSQIDSPIDVES